MEIAEPTKQGGETAVKSHARIQKSSSVHHSLSNRFMKHVKSPESLIPNFQSLKIRPRSTDDRVYLTRGHKVGTFEVPDQQDHTTASNMHEIQDPETPNRRSLTSPFTKGVISEGTGECHQQSPESCQSPSDAVTIRHPPSDLVPERLKHCHQEDDLKAEATDEIRPLSFARRASWRYSGLRNLVPETKRNRIEKQDNVSRGGTSPNPEDEKRSGQPLSPTMAQSIAEMARKRLEWGKKDTKDKTLTKIRNFEGETKPGETDDILPNSVLQRKECKPDPWAPCDWHE
ncbi:hypothetical protein Plec18167_003113 [Paecilomyces lecythidis]|uniref:Uncharacterized protein n=1 Tax=Paecilomyces lecythidis TaxID=3004212 RepID=A0ABR3Y158_9EURO